MSQLRIKVFGLLGSITLLGAQVVGQASATAAPPDAGAGAVVTVPAARLLDTRSSSPLSARATLNLAVVGHGGLPSVGIAAVVLNVTALRSTAGGYVTVWAGGLARPATGNLNFAAGQAVGNLVLAPLGADGTVNLYNGSDGTVELVADVSGYVRSGTAADAGAVVPVPAARILDTRSGLGGAQLAARATLRVHVGGLGGVPRGAAAVVLDVTALRSTAGGYVTVWAGGLARPATGNLNFAAGQAVGNLVLAPLGADGTVNLYNGSDGTVELVADVSGYVRSGTAADAGAVVPVPAARILDTRSGLGGVQLAARATLRVHVSGLGGVPRGAAAVVLDVTALRSTAGGYVTVWAGGLARPATGNLNFAAGQAVGNLVLAPLGADGTINLYNGSTGTLHLVADVFGYVRSGTASAVGALVPLTPARVLDTRSDVGGSRLAPRATLNLTVVGHGGVPASGVAAVVLDVTALRSTAAGYVAVWAGGRARPGTGNLNFAAGQAVGNLVLAPVGADGTINLYNGSGGTLDLVADVFGYVRANGPCDVVGSATPSGRTAAGTARAPLC